MLTFEELRKMANKGITLPGLFLLLLFAVFLIPSVSSAGKPPEDTTPPLVDSTVPTNGATGVTVNSNVTITWDEPIQCATVNTTTITIDSGGWTLDSCAGIQAVFTPDSQSPTTIYVVTVSTSVTDLAGNNMASAYNFSYTTDVADVTAPQVDTTDPADTDTGVDRDSNVTINWNEDIDCTTVTTSSVTITTPYTSWDRTSCSGSQAVFKPTGQSATTSYTVTVSNPPTDEVEDLAGNPMASSYEFTYETGTNVAISCTLYVDNGCIGGTCDTSPYGVWDDAAASIADAVAVASSGDVVCVRATATEYAADFKDGVTVMAEDYLSARPLMAGPVNVPGVAGGYVPGTALDGFHILNESPSMRIQGSDCSGPDGISNNLVIRNMLIEGGTKPAIKHDGGCPTVGPNNTFKDKDRACYRIYQTAGSASEALVIKGNTFDNCGISTSKDYSNLHFEKDATANRYVLIQDNIIKNNNHSGGMGIDEGSNDVIYITGNQIHNNIWAGIRIGTTDKTGGAPHIGQITISGEPSFTFPAGSSYSYTDGAPNEIYSNGRGGITTRVGVTMDIIRNEIYNNTWGGIHTGNEEPLLGLFAWESTEGDAVLTIKKNKVYGNGTNTDVAGGGIDVMWASGTIANNVVYDNQLAGIRVGPGAAYTGGMTIRHNTVVDNGGGSTPDQAVAGGGIVYHDGFASDGTTPCYYCRPHGDAPGTTTVEDSVIAYTAKAAMRGMSTANGGYAANGGYNLLYANQYPSWAVLTEDCSDPSTWRCYIAQYGFSANSPHPNDIFANPLFVNDAYTTSDDLMLQESSPGAGTASDSGDRGAWGGSDPIDW